MNQPAVREQVTDYWENRAPLFDGAASHRRHDGAWARVLEAAFATEAPCDVVDLGTGTGACALTAASLGHRVRAFDASPAMLGVAKAEAARRGLRVEFIESYLEDIDTAPADIVTLRNVLWTVEDPSAILARAFRALRPGGRLVVSDGLWSVSPNDRSTYDPRLADMLPLHAGLTEATARRLLGEAGFGNPQSWQHLFEEPPYPNDVPFFVLSVERPVDR